LTQGWIPAREEERVDEGRAGPDLLQASITVGVFAIALDAFSEDKGPEAGGVRVLVVGFVLASIFAIFGACYAVAVAWAEFSSDDLEGRDLMPLAKGAVFYTGLSLALLMLSGLTLMVDSAR
jgi:hypothetical protein